ncbi:lysophospholipid acyltransferase family protein [Rapidithrix thailandica]|uniref:Lysophospholipid acyltransferase family protein n=1 Tax=Rapidithrix thailandica TaxID=413964 RepID=A0AAW9S827_9BACT
MFFLKVLSRLPLPILYIIGDFLFFIAYYVLKYRRDVVAKNLKDSFPEKSPKELAQIEKEYYRYLSDFLIEMIKEITFSKKELQKRFVWKPCDDLKRVMDAGDSVILLAAHYINWEWGLLSLSVNLPFPLTVIYQKLSNKTFDKLVLDMRTRFGGEAVEKDTSMMSMLRSARKQRAIVINADQLPQRSAKSERYWKDFLHRETAFFTGADRMAKILKTPVFFLNIKRTQRGYYEMRSELLAEPPYTKTTTVIMDKYVEATERQILRDPSPWLWSHKRWKYTREEVEPVDNN